MALVLVRYVAFKVCCICKEAFIGITHNLLVLCFHNFGHGEVFQELFVEILGDWPWGRNRSDYFLKTEPIK